VRPKSRCGSPEGNVQSGRKTSVRAAGSHTYGAGPRRKSSSTRLTSMARFASDLCVSRPRRMDIAARRDRRDNSVVSPRSRRRRRWRPANAKRVPMPRHESPPVGNSRISHSSCAESGHSGFLKKQNVPFFPARARMVHVGSRSRKSSVGLRTPSPRRFRPAA
jgi:hypothetical protein